MSISRQSITFASVILILSTLFSNGLGIVREVLLAKYYGTDRHYDLFVLSQYLPSTLIAAFFYGIPSVFVPLYYEVLEGRGKDQADSFQRSFFTFWIVVAVCVCSLAVIFAPVIVGLIFGHLPMEERDVLVRSTRIMMTGAFFSIAYMLIRAILSAHKHFLYPAVSMLALNVTVIAALIIYGRDAGIDLLSISTALGMVMQWMVLMWFLYRRDEVPQFSDRWLPKEVGDSLRIALPVMGIEMLWGVFYFLDGYFASQLSSGNVSVVNYALVLFRFPNFLFGITIGMALLPAMSKSYSMNNIADVSEKFIAGLRMLFLICMVFTMLFMMFGMELISLMFQRGAFDERSVSMTSAFLVELGPSCFFLAGYPVVLRMMSALRKNTVMIGIFIAGLVVKYILVAFVFDEDGLHGLAMAINVSLGVSFTTSLLYAYRQLLFDAGSLLWFFIRNTAPLIVMMAIPSGVPSYLGAASVLILWVVLNPAERGFLLSKLPWGRRPL